MSRLVPQGGESAPDEGFSAPAPTYQTQSLAPQQGREHEEQGEHGEKPVVGDECGQVPAESSPNFLTTPKTNEGTTCRRWNPSMRRTVFSTGFTGTVLPNGRGGNNVADGRRGTTSMFLRCPGRVRTRGSTSRSGRGRSHAPVPAWRKEAVVPQGAWNAKRERQYDHVKEGLLERGDSEDLAEEIAARPSTRSGPGLARRRSRAALRPMTSPRDNDGGLRSHHGPGGRTRDQLYDEARPARHQGPVEDVRGNNSNTLRTAGPSRRGSPRLRACRTTGRPARSMTTVRFRFGRRGYTRCRAGR